MSMKHARQMVNGGADKPENFTLPTGTTAAVPLTVAAVVGEKTIVHAVYVTNLGSGSVRLDFKNVVGTDTIFSVGAPNDGITHRIDGVWEGAAGDVISVEPSAAPGGADILVMIAHAQMPV